MAFDLSQLSLMSSVLEFRYPPRFVIWDQVGQFWAELLEGRPEAEVKHAEPNRTIVKVSPSLEASVGIDIALVSTAGPSPDLNELKLFATSFKSDLVDKLDIASFNRIGYRNVFFKNFKGPDEASDFILGNCNLPRPQGQHFGFAGRLKEPELGLRWEGEKHGCHIRVSAKTQRVNIEIPVNFGGLLSPEKQEVNTAFVDIDYFLHSETAADQVDVEDMLNTWARVTRRDLGKLLDGG